jgi:hypothetical protein
VVGIRRPIKQVNACAGLDPAGDGIDHLGASALTEVRNALDKASHAGPSLVSTLSQHDRAPATGRYGKVNIHFVDFLLDNAEHDFYIAPHGTRSDLELSGL